MVDITEKKVQANVRKLEAKNKKKEP